MLSSMCPHRDNIISCYCNVYVCSFLNHLLSHPLHTRRRFLHLIRTAEDLFVPGGSSPLSRFSLFLASEEGEIASLPENCDVESLAQLEPLIGQPEQLTTGGMG